jgi:hypothetical protein
MKIKTCVKLSKEVRDRDQRDLRTINRLSEKLNNEAEDVLDYQWRRAVERDGTLWTRDPSPALSTTAKRRFFLPSIPSPE